GRSQGLLSPEIRLVHTLSARTEIRASVSSRAETPSYLDLFSRSTTDLVITNFPYSGTDVDVGSTTTFEIGVRHAISRDVQADVAGYDRNNVTDGAMTVPEFDPVS